MTTIVTKNGSGAPLASDLVQGELAVDLTNKRLYTEDSGGTVIELGSNPSTLTTGSATFSGDLAVDTDTLFVDVSAGNVGIGTSSPQSSQKLHIADTSGNCEMTLQSSDSGVASLLFGDATDFSRGKVTYDNSSDSMAFQVNNLQEAMRIDASGNVGIGTSITNSKLSFGTSAVDTVPSDISALALYDNGSTIKYGLGVSDSQLNYKAGLSSDSHVWYAGTTERMRIDASGNVGIGTTESTAQIVDSQIGGLGRAISLPTGSDINSVYNASSLSGGATRLSITSIATASLIPAAKYSQVQEGSNELNVAHVWYGNDGTNPDELMRIDSSGNVGIGTSSPSAPLHVLGTSFDTFKLYRTSDFSPGIEFGNVIDGALANIYADSTEATPKLTLSVSGSPDVNIDSSGNLLVGRTTNVTGNENCFQSRGGNTTLWLGNSATSGNGGYALACTNNSSGATRNLVYFGVGISSTINVGTITTNGTTTSYNTTSDVRLKENIVDAPAGNIDDIRVRSFDWKADGSHQTYGMVAQELVDVAPEAVSQGETEDNMWGVDYSKLVPMMIKEIQDLKAEVAALKGA